MSAPSIGYSSWQRPTDDQGQGFMRACWFRWHACGEPGYYIVCTDYDGLRRGERYDLENTRAIVDDFGNLRRVQ